MNTSDPLLMLLIGGVVAAVPVLFAAYVKSQAAGMMELERQRDSYKGMADRAILRLEQEVADRRAREGFPAVVPVAPVLPEHQSPVTANQQETADMATLRARLVAAELGSSPLPPLPPPED